MQFKKHQDIIDYVLQADNMQKDIYIVWRDKQYIEKAKLRAYYKFKTKPKICEKTGEISDIETEVVLKYSHCASHFVFIENEAMLNDLNNRPKPKPKHLALWEQEIKEIPNVYRSFLYFNIFSTYNEAVDFLSEILNANL